MGKRAEDFKEKLKAYKIDFDMDDKIKKYKENFKFWEDNYAGYLKSIKNYGKIKKNDYDGRKKELKSIEKYVTNILLKFCKIPNWKDKKTGWKVSKKYMFIKVVGDPLCEVVSNFGVVITTAILDEKIKKVKTLNYPILSKLGETCIKVKTGEQALNVVKKLILEMKATVAFCKVNPASFLAKTTKWLEKQIEHLSNVKKAYETGKSKHDQTYIEISKNIKEQFEMLSETLEKDIAESRKA